MALRNPFMVKLAASTTDLELKAEAGQSFLVRDILIHNPAGNYLTVRVDRRTVGYFRVGGTLGNHLALPAVRTQHAHDITTGSTTPADQTTFADLENAGAVNIGTKVLGGLAKDTTYSRAMGLAGFLGSGFRTILGLLGGRGLFKGYPVPEGKTFTLTGAAQSGCYQLVIYEEYDAHDIRGTMPNGPDSDELLYIAYGNAGGNINTNGDSELTTLKNPGEFCGFPFSDSVPSNSSIELLGILASSFSPLENDGTDSIYTSYLKLIRERETLFDPDRAGILMIDATTTTTGSMDRVGEGVSLIGNYSSVDAKLPLLFDPALRFAAGEDVDVYWTTVKANSGQNIAIDEHEVGLVLRLKRGR